MMKMILLFVLVTMACTVFGQGKTPPPPPPPLSVSPAPAPKLSAFLDFDDELEVVDAEDEDNDSDVVKYVEDYIKKHTKEPTPKGEFETAYEWQARVRKEKDEQRKELMHKALYELYGNPFEKKINLRLGQYDIEHGYFPMETNGLGTYVLPADRENGPEWRGKWNSGKFSIRNTYKYGLVNGKPRLVFCAAIKNVNTDQEIYLFDNETGKFIEFVWRNDSWEIGKKFTEFEKKWSIWKPGRDREEERLREEARKKKEEEYGNKILDKVDQMPQFNGNMGLWLRDNLKYPIIAQENGIMGRVFVAFVVEKDGSITDVEVAKSVDPSLDEEAIRVVKTMSGKWRPGKIDGVPVRVAYTMPINFTLSN